MDLKIEVAIALVTIIGFALVACVVFALWTVVRDERASARRRWEAQRWDPEN